MTSRNVRAGFAVWILVITALYYAFPNDHLYTWAALGYSSVAAILVGVRLYRPERRLPWYLLAGALAVFNTGDNTYNLIIAFGHETPAFPGIADLLYLLVYPLLTGAFVLFLRNRSDGVSNRAALLDALVPTVGLGLLSWIYWIAPFTRSADLTALQKIVSIGYPLGDVLVLAMTLRMLTTPGRRPAALSAITVAIVGLLISDIFYGQSQLNSAWTLGGPVDLGWIVCYAVLGFTALMPSMRRLTEPQPYTTVTGSNRIIWMASAALIAPAVLLLEWAGGQIIDAPIIAGAAALMFVLVLARVNGLATEQRKARARERALRQAGSALFSAANEHEAIDAVREATATLLPAGTPYRLSVTDRAVGVEPFGGIRLITAAELPPGVPARGFKHFLYATMALPGKRTGAGLLGAPGHVLRELQPSFQALFEQIEVVVDRIILAAEVNRRDSEAYFRTLIQNASDVILIVGADDRILYASPSAETVFGHPELVGTPMTALIAVGGHEALHAVLADIRDGAARAEGTELSAVCADGGLLRVECAGRDLRDDPTVRGLVLTIRDVTDRKRLEDDLSHLAFHDGLTGLGNRVLFRNRLELAHAQAIADGLTLAVLFVDLDDFKEVNDTLGHAVGDQLLVAVGQRIDTIIGTAGTAARMGGDEFAIMIEPGEDATAAEQIAEQIVNALAVPVEVGDGAGGSLIVSGAASVGLATTGDADGPTELLRCADLALYQAKGSEKGTWQRYRSELHNSMVERLETRAALHEAIEQEQFRVLYQPIVELDSGRMSGVESLVRWQHPTRGLLSPYLFVEIAEESGAIVEIGAFVLREALRQFAEWKAADPDTTLRYVSVNVSARQFRTPGFVDQVRRALADAGADPSWLLLEITESLVLRDAEQVWADLRALRALGVRTAIDDFGTGYSSLSYLRQMPVDVLKLDKSFIDEILESTQQHALVDAIATLARNLDLAVVAEGIEHAGQHASLAAMGCPYGQGYLFSKPVWPHEIAALAHTEAALV